MAKAEKQDRPEGTAKPAEQRQQPEQADKLERLHELFPDAVRNDGELEFDLLRQEIRRAEAERRQAKANGGDQDDAENRRLAAIFNAGAAVERNASTLLLVASGVVLGLMFNSFFQPGMQYSIFHAAIFFAGAALLAFTALFVIFVIFAIDAHFRRHSAYDIAGEGADEWRDSAPAGLRAAGAIFMLLRIVPEADGTSAAHVRVRRGANYYRGRVSIHDFARKAYRVPWVSFLLGLACGIAFFVLQATNNG